MKLAILAITKNGSALARRIWESYPEGADLYLPKRFVQKGERGVKRLSDDLASDVAKVFGKKYKGLAFVMAAGIVVRLIAPHLKSKLTDPAVIVLDERGEYVISLLSGHAGGANDLAEAIAELIGGEPVITTASDVQESIAVDTLADELGCEVEDYRLAKTVTAAIVNEEPVAAYCHFGPDFVYDRVENVPANVSFYEGIEDVLEAERAAAIAVTPFLLPEEVMYELMPAAMLRPKILVVGIGCNRGTSAKEIQTLFDDTLEEHGLSKLSVRNIATIEDKRDEAGITSFARNNGLKVEYIPKERLVKAATPSGRSEKVFSHMGVYGVCEPALRTATSSRIVMFRPMASGKRR